MAVEFGIVGQVAVHDETEVCERADVISMALNQYVNQMVAEAKMAHRSKMYGWARNRMNRARIAKDESMRWHNIAYDIMGID